MVYCNKCKEGFEVSSKTQFYKGYPEGIEETYFKCPNCGERYSLYFTDINIRHKQERIKRLYREAMVSTDINYISRIISKIECIKKGINLDYDNLVNKYCKKQIEYVFISKEDNSSMELKLEKGLFQINKHKGSEQHA
ncbi:hypothetical protein [Clostridium rectalis]|uniref:hypothetical protein n=1 Tax=Clostridium rectalis TaxID=2040295 RepID=UPI000F63D1D2|nr:hypothetical protein [Clostridium rectalis]